MRSLTVPPRVIWGADGRPAEAEHFDTKVRRHRPPLRSDYVGRSKNSQCTHRQCTEPAVIDRTTPTVRSIEAWRALCRTHALSFADKLGESLAALVRQMVQ